jgi:acetyl-CoA acyltransferase
VPVVGAKGAMHHVTRDEHPRETDLAALANLSTPFRSGGTVTAGNSSGVNDGACAVLLADERSAIQHGLTPRARILGTAVAGVEPRLMGLGPVPAVRKLLARTGVDLGSIEIIELNEAFAAQALAVLRTLGIADDAAHVNRYGGAIALGHPLGASGARLVTTAMHQLGVTQHRYALCSLCVGVGQGIAMLIERI